MPILTEDAVLGPRAQILARLQALRTAAGRPPLQEEPLLSVLAAQQVAEWVMLRELHRRHPQQYQAPDEALVPPETPAGLAVSRALPGAAAFYLHLPLQSLAEIEGQPLVDPRYEQVGVGVMLGEAEPAAAIVLLLRPRLPPQWDQSST